MTRLTHADWLILLLYLASILGIGFIVRSAAKTAKDFFQAGRALPGWVCALAFVAIGLGAPEVIAMGGLGAKYGLEAAQFFGIGAIPAMVFAGLFMVPLYYGSKARTLPEFLGMRFDWKTRVLNACLFLAMTVFTSGIALYMLARAVEGTRLFDSIFVGLSLPESAIFPCVIGISSLFVAACVMLGGLTGAIYNQVLQFLLMVAGLLPVVVLGLKDVGGWAGLRSALPAGHMHEWMGVLPQGGHPMGVGAIGLIVGLGFALGGGYWCSGFQVMQTAMAAHDVEAARRVPLIAAIPRMLLPFLVVLPGLVAIALPTPHSVTMVTRNPDGSIIHNIQVASPEAEQGKGIVPARLDPASRKVMAGANGQPLLDYDMATPSMLVHYLPTGMLGLGLAALLAACMSGMAGNVTAFNAVFTCDLYQACLRKDAGEGHYVTVGRWATGAAVLLSVVVAFAATRFDGVWDMLLLACYVLAVPLFAIMLLAMFWKRATADGAFAGLIAGTVGAVLHHGLTLAVGAHPGIHGGWIRVAHTYSSDMAQNFQGAIVAFGAAAVVAVAVSLVTKAKPEAELVGLVHRLTPRPQPSAAWWRRPEALAIAVLIAAIALNLLFA